jgi:hypothetical protein
VSELKWVAGYGLQVAVCGFAVDLRAPNTSRIGLFVEAKDVGCARVNRAKLGLPVYRERIFS